MGENEKAVKSVHGILEKSLSAKHQIAVLNRNPAPGAPATSGLSADSSGKASGKADKK